MNKLLLVISWALSILTLSTAANAQQVFSPTFTGVSSSFQDVEQSPGFLTVGAFSVVDPFYPSDVFDEEFANFAVFDLTSLSSPVSSANLEYFLPSGGYDSSDLTEDFVIHDFPGNPSSLSYGGFGDFLDLSSGVLLGSTTVDQSDEGTFVSVQLNSDGISEINSNAGGLVAFGGSGAAFTPGQSLGFGGLGSNSVSLTVTPTAVPEPGCGNVIVIFGLVGLRRRRE